MVSELWHGISEQPSAVLHDTVMVKVKTTKSYLNTELKDPILLIEGSSVIFSITVPGTFRVRLENGLEWYLKQTFLYEATDITTVHLFFLHTTEVILNRLGFTSVSSNFNYT